MSNSLETFGNYIRKRRLQLGMTQTEVSKKLQVTQNYITYLEKNQRRPADSLLKDLAGVLSLPLDKLYLAAHPEFSDFIQYDSPSKSIRNYLPPMLQALKNDRELRAKHQITDAEIEELASLKLRGEIKHKEDYIFLLMSIRQVMK